MKTIVKTILYLQMTALLLTTALAGPAAAGKAVPFRGTIQAVEISDFHPPTFSVDGTGAGRATHLGQFTFTYEFEVVIATGVGVGSAEFTAANGDSLFTGVLGQGSEVVDAVAFVVELHTITGGTGRFADATGSFTLKRVVNVVTGSPPVRSTELSHLAKRSSLRNRTPGSGGAKLPLFLLSRQATGCRNLNAIKQPS